MEYAMSIDNLTVTGNISYRYKPSLQELLSSGVIECSQWQTPNNIFYQWNFNFPDGTFFQYGKGVSGADQCRIEFNPNKCDVNLVYKLILRMKIPKITRIDWACDIFGYDFKDATIQSLTGRKTEEIKSRSGRRETLYIGSRKSDNFIRLYDKARELKKDLNEPENEIDTDVKHWRFEAVTKDFNKVVEKDLISLDDEGNVVTKKVKVKEDDVFINPFNIIVWNEKECVELENSGVLDNLKTQEKAMIYYLNSFPSEWHNLSYNSKKKYESIYYERCMDLFEYEYQPFNLWEKEKNRLITDIEEWIKPALLNSFYITSDSYVSPDKYNRGKIENHFNVMLE